MTAPTAPIFLAHYRPSFSHDFKKAVYFDPLTNVVTLIEIDSLRKQALYKVEETISDHLLAWSPDNQVVSYLIEGRDENRLIVLNINDLSSHQYLLNGWGYPEWSQNGKYLLLHGYRDPSFTDNFLQFKLIDLSAANEDLYVEQMHVSEAKLYCNTLIFSTIVSDGYSKTTHLYTRDLLKGETRRINLGVNEEIYTFFPLNNCHDVAFTTAEGRLYITNIYGDELRDIAFPVSGEKVRSDHVLTFLKHDLDNVTSYKLDVRVDKIPIPFHISNKSSMHWINLTSDFSAGIYWNDGASYLWKSDGTTYPIAPQNKYLLVTELFTVENFSRAW